MIEKIYNKMLKDNEIKDIYNKIEEYEINTGGWCYHNYNHVMNVTKMVVYILKELNFNEEDVAKGKIACLLHDTGAILGKDNHAYRSYTYAKEYFKKNDINFKDIDLVLEAIKDHSNNFDTDNIYTLALILSDKLDTKSNRVTEVGKTILGNRQYTHIKDIKISIKNNLLSINYITDKNIDIKELNEFYFTKKVFNAIKSFSNKMNLNYKVYIDNNEWSLQ